MSRGENVEAGPRGTFALMDLARQPPRADPAQIFMSSQRRRRLHPAPRARRGAGFLRFCSELVDQRPTGVPRVVIRSLDWPKCCHVARTSRHCQTADRPRFRALSHLCQLSAASFRRPIRCPVCRPRIGHPAPVRIDSAHSAAPLPHLVRGLNCVGMCCHVFKSVGFSYFHSNRRYSNRYVVAYPNGLICMAQGQHTGIDPPFRPQYWRRIEF